MPEQKVRIGFVGVGNMGQCAHLKNYANLDICQVVAIAEIREPLRRKVAARYGIPNSYPTHEKMLQNEALDGIVAAQPFGRYGMLVPELLKAGIPVFTEKAACRFHRSRRKNCRCYEERAGLGTWLAITNVATQHQCMQRQKSTVSKHRAKSAK